MRGRDLLSEELSLAVGRCRVKVCDLEVVGSGANVKYDANSIENGLCGTQVGTSDQIRGAVTQPPGTSPTMP